ncbi:RHS repeat-associated core domain-containing protein [Flavobacterium psychrophilum]|uniref:RHS repeat-associated core domain-containing protein n=1 Tax=Flavobacterium psychrophilum TaxID=96345 RepID=UPI0029149A22|nr:hypothetical protein [Flavobacterium psychrophilum]
MRFTDTDVKAGEGFVGNGLPEKDVFYFHPDHLGSSSYISTLNGQISQHVEYIAFGEVLFEEHSSSFKSPYLFNGKELDRETNLTNFGARYLDMKTSLWLNVDPMAEKYPDWNPYNYCMQNPINMIDPTGMEGEKAIDPPVNNSKPIVLDEVVIQGHKRSTASKVADVATDFCPIVGGCKDIYKGYNSGNNWQIAMGVGILVLDIATLGSDELLIGSAKTIGKEIVEQEAKNIVYHSIEGGITKYVGITNNFARREAEHLAKKGIKIEPLMQGLTRTDARAVEQALIEINGLSKNGGTLKNIINSISKLNPKYSQQLERGYELLKSIGY